jgi:hypothetical protein
MDTQAISPEQARGLAEPAGGSDIIIAPYLALPEPLRARAAFQILDEIDAAALALPDYCWKIRITLWSWRLFAFSEDDRSELPELYLACTANGKRKGLVDMLVALMGGTPAPRPTDPTPEHLPDPTLRFDAYAHMLRHAPSLASPILVRSAMLALWSADGLRRQHLGSDYFPDSRAAGDLLAERGSDWASYFRGARCAQALALVERRSFKLAAPTHGSAGRGTRRI